MCTKRNFVVEISYSVFPKDLWSEVITTAYSANQFLLCIYLEQQKQIMIWRKIE